MPTLTAQKNPPMIFPPAEILPPQEHGMEWYVGCVKSRQEKKIAFDLIAREIPYYLPMQAYQTKAANRTISAMRLLFPGYIFFHTTPTDKANVPVYRKSYGMFQIIAVKRQLALYQELIALLTISRSSLRYDSFEAYIPGKKIHFHAGPLEGQTFEIKQSPTGTNLQLKVDMLGAAMFTIDLAQHQGQYRLEETVP